MDCPAYLFLYLVVYVEGLQEGQAECFTIRGSQNASVGFSPVFNHKTKTLELDLMTAWDIAHGDVANGDMDSIKVSITLSESDQKTA